MSVRDFALTLVSTQNHDYSIYRSILNASTTQKVLLPALVPLSKDDAAQLYPSHSISEEQLEQLVSKTEQSFMLVFHPDNGLRFSSTVSRVSPYSVLVVSFGKEHLQNGQVSYGILKGLLETYVPLFRADYAKVHLISTKTPSKPLVIQLKDQRINVSLDIGWMMYFGSDLVNEIGSERFLEPTVYEKIEINGGYLLTLQEEPFDPTHSEHLAREAVLIEQLDLQRFLKKKSV